MAKKTKERVREFWNSSPCGTYLAESPEGQKRYYKEIESLRYSRYPYAYDYLPEWAGFRKFKGEKVLEVGCGIGTDLIQFARGGAQVTGIDLTPEGIRQAKKRFGFYGLKAKLSVGDAEELPFGDESFDLIYSFGVLHHTPNTQKAVNEVRRVLKKGGIAKVMLYNKVSAEYFLHLLRKVIHPERWAWSTERAVSYQTEMNRNPEGPENPLTKVYTPQEARELFSKFSECEVAVNWFCPPVFGRVTPKFVRGILGKSVGWHLLITAKK